MNAAKTLILTALLAGLALSCKTAEPVEVKPAESVPEAEPAPEQIKTGWSDENTYTVSATGSDSYSARRAAEHRVLKDIVNVRVRNNSRFTDITRIRDEFSKPLRDGIILREEKTGDGVKIYFQITDEGLKQKFQRK